MMMARTVAKFTYNGQIDAATAEAKLAFKPVEATGLTNAHVILTVNGVDFIRIFSDGSGHVMNGDNRRTTQVAGHFRSYDRFQEIMGGSV
jgi:hypothetical protein